VQVLGEVAVGLTTGADAEPTSLRGAMQEAKHVQVNRERGRQAAVAAAEAEEAARRAEEDAKLAEQLAAAVETEIKDDGAGWGWGDESASVEDGTAEPEPETETEAEAGAETEPEAAGDGEGEGEWDGDTKGGERAAVAYEGGELLGELIGAGILGGMQVASSMSSGLSSAFSYAGDAAAGVAGDAAAKIRTDSAALEQMQHLLPTTVAGKGIEALGNMGESAWGMLGPLLQNREDVGVEAADLAGDGESEEMEAMKQMRETNLALHKAISEDMLRFAYAHLNGTIQEWAITSEWTRDTGGERDASGAPLRVTTGIFAELFQVGPIAR
jgi:hypothetical protein